MDRVELCASTRLSMTYVLRWMERVRASFGGDIILGLVWMGLVQGNVSHLDRDPDQSRKYSDIDHVPPDDLRRSMRMLSLAESLGLPRESVRRKVATLVAVKAAVRTPQGYYVPASVLAGEANLASLHQMMAEVQILIEGLSRGGLAGMAKTETAPTVAPHHRQIARLSTNFGLRALDDLRIAFDGEVITGLIFLSLVDASLPPDAPPGEPPRAISVQALAGIVGLPRETMRRHMQRIQARDLCRSVSGGVVVIADPLGRSELFAAARRSEVHLRLLLSQLRRMGALPESD